MFDGRCLMGEVLVYIFNICILIGFVIPLLNLLTGWFGGFFDVGADIDLDIDAPPDLGADIGNDTNTGSGAVIPFNIMCLCLFLVVFGAFGHMARGFMTSTTLVVLLLLGCAVCAALSYFGLYKLLIKRLKNSDASAISYDDLYGKSAVVTLRLTPDSIGTISMRDSTGAPISFRAKMDADLKDQMPETFASGETVIITGVDKENKLCYVSVPFRKFTDNNI